MGGKLRDIALIYAAYDARLRSGDFDARSRLQKLREHLEGSGYLRGCDVYLDGFHTSTARRRAFWSWCCGRPKASR